ncbi:hypothetical protein F2Q70_00026624 [Brassica cretica]|uniref:Protein kinase domain-containing protein n=1 Tax=Brassica cretica TaxID=69181 RepID=A0A8S9LCA9_BRACR|nr:hypothetical protein F2Q70_00026624 [Brassica cretica]
MGSCLEFLHPVLVFEDLEYRSLNTRGSVGSLDTPVLPWNVRLKIAKEIAVAITYLHTAFPRIIVHRDINATNVLLDKNGRAKLTGFSLAVTLPEEYMHVYSFGVLLIILLTGRSVYFTGSEAYPVGIIEYVKGLYENKKLKEERDEDRPKLIQIAKELKRVLT